MSVRPYRTDREIVIGDFLQFNDSIRDSALNHFNMLLENDTTGFRHQIEYAVLAGSWLFGLAHENSDMDFKGLHVSPLKTILRLNGTNSTTGRGGTIVSLNGEQVEFQEIEKFINGCISNNPTILEVLFADIDFVLYMGEVPLELRSNAKKFLVPEKIFQAFSNYAIDQVNYMKSKLWNLFENEEVELAKQVVMGYDFDHMNLEKIGFGFHDMNLNKLKIDKIKKIANFEAAYEKYPQYFDDRYDTKHAAHSLRLLMSGYHCLRYGEFITMPPEEGIIYLRDIRKGNVNLKDFFKYTRDMFSRVISARQNPAWEREEPDYNFINDLLFNIRMKYI